MTNEEFQKAVLEQFEKMNQRLDNLEGQAKETNDFVRVLLHRTEELDAKYDSLLHTVVTKDFVKATIEPLEIKIDVLTHRVLAQDGEIQLLKRVK